MELTRVSAQLRRDEAAISDRNDERKRERYTIAVAADIDPDYVARQWYVNDYDFGTKYLRRMVIRWVNLGRLGAHGASPPDRRERGAGPAVPRLRGLRRARQDQPAPTAPRSTAPGAATARPPTSTSATSR